MPDDQQCLSAASLPKIEQNTWLPNCATGTITAQMPGDMYNPYKDVNRGRVPSGVLVNQPFSILDGWTRHYDEPYSHHTTEEIIAVTPSTPCGAASI